jgi:hypothetical protein
MTKRSSVRSFSLTQAALQYEAELKNQEMMQKRVLQRTRATAIILGIAFIVAILFFVFAYLQKYRRDDRTVAGRTANSPIAKRTEDCKSEPRPRRRAERIVRERNLDYKPPMKNSKNQQALEVALNEARIARNDAERNMVEANIQRDSARVERNKGQSEFARAEETIAQRIDCSC